MHEQQIKRLLKRHLLKALAEIEKRELCLEDDSPIRIQNNDETYHSVLHLIPIRYYTRESRGIPIISLEELQRIVPGTMQESPRESQDSAPESTGWLMFSALEQAVVGELQGGRVRSREQLAEACGEAPLGRIRGVLSNLVERMVIDSDPRGYWLLIEPQQS